MLLAVSQQAVITILEYGFKNKKTKHYENTKIYK